MKSQKKSRFVNLAAQIAEQNDIVNSTMDSLLAKVAQDVNLESRSDYDQIKKTAELNPEISSTESQEELQRTVPKPKLAKPKVNQNFHVNN